MGERSICWLPMVCSHELLEFSTARREKLFDVQVSSPYHVWLASYKKFNKPQVNVCVCVCVHSMGCLHYK